MRQFMSQHNLVSRHKFCLKTPEQLKKSIIEYLLLLEQKRRVNNYKHIFTLDEIIINLDYSENLPLGNKNVRF